MMIATKTATASEAVWRWRQCRQRRHETTKESFLLFIYLCFSPYLSLLPSSPSPALSLSLCLYRSLFLVSVTDYTVCEASINQTTVKVNTWKWYRTAYTLYTQARSWLFSRMSFSSKEKHSHFTHTHRHSRRTKSVTHKLRWAKMCKKKKTFIQKCCFLFDSFLCKLFSLFC